MSDPTDKASVAVNEQRVRDALYMAVTDLKFHGSASFSNVVGNERFWNALIGAVQHCVAVELAERALSPAQGDGTPKARLTAIGDFAVKHGLCNGFEAKAPEVFLMEAYEKLQGDGMRDALVKRLQLWAGYTLDGQSLRGLPFALKQDLSEAAAALASHPDRQPGMTDEQSISIATKEYERDPYRHPIEIAAAAIKCASQRQ